MTAATSWTNAKKQSEKLRRTGLSDAGSDYPTLPPSDYPIVSVESILIGLDLS